MKLKIREYLHQTLVYTRRVPLPVVVFIAIALLTGFIFIKNIGSFTGPDMYIAHYRASFALATGQSFSKAVQEGDQKLQFIEGSDKYLNSGKACIRNIVTISAIENPLEPDTTRACIRAYDTSVSELHDVRAAAIIQYPPLGYIPQAAGIGLGIITNLQPIDSQTLARVFNLLMYILIVAFSIVLLPKGRWLATVIALLPTSIFLASSLSADALNIAWSFLFVSYTIRLYLQKPRLSTKQMVFLSLLGCGLFLLKVAYAPLILLLLGFKKRQIDTRKKWLFFLSTLMVGALLYLIWSSHWSSLNAVVDVSQNFSAILHNIPQATAGILVSILYMPTELFEISNTLYLTLAIMVGAIVIAYLRKVDVSKIKQNKAKDLHMIVYASVAIIGSLGLTYAALLLTWTDIGVHGWTGIQGFQGRYILPLLPLLLLIYTLPLKKQLNVSTDAK